jgi:hypothetical protein
MLRDGSAPETVRLIKLAAIPGILLECAFGAVVQGFAVLLMGGIAARNPPFDWTPILCPFRMPEA